MWFTEAGRDMIINVTTFNVRTIGLAVTGGVLLASRKKSALVLVPLEARLCYLSDRMD